MTKTPNRAPLVLVPVVRKAGVGWGADLSASEASYAAFTPTASADEAPSGAAGRLLQLARSVVRHRLAQFAFFGTIIFVVAPRTERVDVIDISSARLAALRAAESARGGAKAASANEVDQRELEDEILYREGVRLGLDKNDGIVRQRIVQKVLFLAEEMAGATRPMDDVGLRAFFEGHRDRWSVGEGFRFEQIYRHSPELLQAWIATPAEPLPKGEPSPVGALVDEDRAHIVQHLGSDFAAAIENVPPGTWAGPVRSTFGWHLVRIVEHRPPRPARFEDVRVDVTEAYSVFRRQEAVASSPLNYRREWISGRDGLGC